MCIRDSQRNSANHGSASWWQVRSSLLTLSRSTPGCRSIICPSDVPTPNIIHSSLKKELPRKRQLLFVVQHQLQFLTLYFTLSLDTSQCNTLNDMLGKNQIYNDNRQDRECNHHIYLAHIKLQPVCCTKLCNCLLYTSYENFSFSICIPPNV